jgi:hypothetical protein
MADPDLELQGAIVQRLKADPAVTALVAGRIYDAPPANATFPYVSYGPTQSISRDFDCITGFDVFIQLDSWSRAVGSPQCKQINDAVRFALHDADLALTTNALVFLEHRSTDARRDPDGLTTHGILSFEAFVERRPAPIIIPPVSPPPPPAPTISIGSLSPNTGARNLSLSVSVLGTDLQPGDKIVFGGIEYDSTFVYSGQITSAAPIATGTTARTVQVYVKRGSAVSNQLSFTVT